jgi:hypothetical protein
LSYKAGSELIYPCIPVSGLRKAKHGPTREVAVNRKQTTFIVVFVIILRRRELLLSSRQKRPIFLSTSLIVDRNDLFGPRLKSFWGRPMALEDLGNRERYLTTNEIVYPENGYYISSGIHNMGHFGTIVAPQSIK